VNNMKKSLIFVALIAALTLSACVPDKPVAQVKNQQAEVAKQAANSIRFDGNAEIENIKKRLELTSNPNLLGFVVLFLDNQPIAYYSVKGKVTSGSKRLTPSAEVNYRSGGTNGNLVAAVTPTPSDEGTFGSSSEYIYFWTTEGRYIQWDGKYLYSDQPIRLRVEPIVTNVTSK